MKGLVVFYSLEGHTKYIAGIIAEKLKCDLLELESVKEYPQKGFKKYFWGGMSVMLKEKPALKNKIPNLNEYDTVFIGTPIWAGTYAPPINTFISENQIIEKNIVLFACHGGGGAEKCFTKLEGELKNNTIIGSIDFPDSNDEILKRDKLNEWIETTFKNN